MNAEQEQAWIMRNSCASWNWLQMRLLRTSLDGNTDVEYIAHEVVKNRSVGSDMAANNELLRMFSAGLLPHNLSVSLKLSKTLPLSVAKPQSCAKACSICTEELDTNDEHCRMLSTPCTHAVCQSGTAVVTSEHRQSGTLLVRVELHVKTAEGTLPAPPESMSACSSKGDDEVVLKRKRRRYN
jgi:hypothetical protein